MLKTVLLTIDKYYHKHIHIILHSKWKSWSADNLNANLHFNQSIIKWAMNSKKHITIFDVTKYTSNAWVDAWPVSHQDQFSVRSFPGHFSTAMRSFCNTKSPTKWTMFKSNKVSGRLLLIYQKMCIHYNRIFGAYNPSLKIVIN